MSMSIGNTYLNGYTTDATESTAEKLTSQIQNADSDDETLQACQQFESYMIQQMFKSMEESAKIFSDEEDEDSSSDYTNMFSDNYLEEISNSMVSNGQGFGIAEKLYESMQRNMGLSNTSATTGTEDTGIS